MMMATVVNFSDKNVIGNAAWTVLQAFAYNYPVNPSQKDKQEFHSLLKSVLRTIPDDECKCRTHAVDYIQSHTPTMNSRKELMQWMCDFHNYVNKLIGKHEFDCKLLFEENDKTCKTCAPKSKQVIQDEDYGIKSVMADYKQLSIKVFEELCKKENLPVPQIVFAPCPEATHTSCTTLIVKKDSQDVNTKKTPVIYFNPSNFGLRVLVHEAKHYIKKMKKEHGDAIDENIIENETQDVIKKYFPADSYDEQTKQLIQPMIMKDSTVAEPVANQTRLVEPLHNYDKGFNTKRFARNARDAFPMYSRRREQSYRDFSEQHSEHEYNSTGTAKGGLLSYFDGLYEPVAKYMNVSARELNLANTPNIFAEGTKMLMNTQLTPFGSIITSTLLGIGMFIATALNKENVGIEDRRLLAQLGGQFLWTGLQNANNPVIQDSAMATGNYLATMEFDKITPLLVKRQSLLSSETVQQNAINARNQQRGAGVRTGSGGISTGSGGVISGIRGVQQREQERAAGVDTRPEGAGIFRNFGSGAGSAVPKMDSGGGLNFTYVPNISRMQISDEEKELLENQGLADLPYYDDAEDMV